MKAVVRRLHSPDVEDLSLFRPAEEAFSLLIQVMAGPADGPGEEHGSRIESGSGSGQIEWLRVLQGGGARRGLADLRRNFFLAGTELAQAN